MILLIGHAINLYRSVRSHEICVEAEMILLLAVDDDIFHKDVVNDAVDIDAVIDYLTDDSFLFF